MEATHTPGPWHVERANGRYEVWPKDCGQPHSYIGAIQRAEDAKLVSSAPELLSALENLFEQCAMTHKHWGEGCNQKQASDAIAFARAAIAKAKGGAL